MLKTHINQREEERRGCVRAGDRTRMRERERKGQRNSERDRVRKGENAPI